MKRPLREALDERGYTELTPVQNAVLDPELEGRDLLVSAQTGSGKTLGFGLAIAPGLLGVADQFEPAASPLALIIAPTRELALQVRRELSWLYAKAGAVVTSCVGGMDMRDERRALARGAHIVVATPGRLRDHIMRESIDLSALQSVVLDEADEMLDLGFREDLEFILGEAPEHRQTLLFSATVSKSIAELATNYQRDAVRVVTKSETKQHADIEYQAMMVADHDTENAVINTLLYHAAPNAIVFANTRAAVNRLTTRLSNRGFQVVALSGELSQAERSHALQAMRDGRAQVCVATDVAARGIDLPNLDLVVHAELPGSHETLLHRSGRTGRAGRKGVSALIVTRKSRKKAERILSMARLTANWASAPSAQEVTEREEARLFADPAWLEPAPETEEALAEALVARFSPTQLATAYLRLYRAQRSAPEDLADVATKPAPRVEFGPSQWFSITGGRKAGADPRRLLPILCKAGNLTRDHIGAIRIQFDQSFVQILDTQVDGFLVALGPEMTLEPGMVVTKLVEAPALETSNAKAAKRRMDKRPAGKPRPAKMEAEESSVPMQKSKSEDIAPRKKRDEEVHRARSAKPGKSAKPGGKPKGPPPPKGKPNSKKNKARRAVAAAQSRPRKKPGKSAKA